MPIKASVSKREKSLTATENRKQEAEQVLASFTSIFLDDVYKLRIDSKLEAMGLIQRRAETISEIRPTREIGEEKGVYLTRPSGWKSAQPAEPILDAIVKGNHEVFRFQLRAWLDSLGEFSRKQLRELAHLADTYRQSYCEGGQEAHWAHTKIEGLLIKDLAQEISRFEPRRGHSSTLGISKDLSSVETWSRWVCEGSPDFDVSESGFAEHWAAPAWYDRWFNTRLWIKHHRPERLTVEQTERVSKSYQRLFADRLQNELTDAEHRVRVELARVDRHLPATAGAPAPAAQPQEKEEVTLHPNRYLERAKSKMKDKVKFPFMDAHEISSVLGVSEKRVYELPGLVPFPTPLPRKRLFTTESVIALYESLRSDEA